GGDVENLLIENRETTAVLRHDVRRVSRIAGALVTEAAPRGVDDDAALLNRRPRQQAPVRIGHCRVALVRADITERSAEPFAPQDGLSGAAARAEILRTADLRAEPRDQFAVAGKAVDRKNHLAGKNSLPFAAPGFDLGADDRALRIGDELAHCIADGERNAALLRRRQQVVDQVLAAT